MNLLVQRLRALVFTYLAVTVGFAVSLAMGAVHIGTLNFWLTAAVGYGIVTLFDFFILATLNDENLEPAQFLFRMMLVVVTMHLAFACIYFWAADETSYLARNGQPITDFVDAVYFSGITLLTVGYGDIVPVGDFRFTAVAEVYGGTLFIFAFFSGALGGLAGRYFRKATPK